jgi:hypothetical protein
MNPLIQLKQTTSVFVVAFGLACFGLSQIAQAVSPPPDGGYTGFNTAEGQDALFSLTTGEFNTAGGVEALFSNTTGSKNTATGAAALQDNTTASNNTATGVAALQDNTTASWNTATGGASLSRNTTGEGNTATGFGALALNTTGTGNTADGFQALVNNTGTGNVALGFEAGKNATTGSGNVYIGPNMQGVAGENNACYIASIFGQTSVNGVPVLINSNNRLGTVTSSKRFKDGIKPMETASETLYALEPVTFRYKKEIDPVGTQQFGLVAEDVQKVNPALVVRDKEGKPYTVRYDAVNAMLLNEFLKEHRKTEKLEAAVAQQQKQIQALTAGLQRVSAQLEVSKPAPQTVLNNQ